MSSTQNANSTNHYILITLAIAVGILGVYLRFAGDAPYWSWAANVILVIGIAIALKAVSSILK